MKLKHFIAAIVSIILLFVGWYTYVHRGYDIVNTPVKDGVFTAFGDSLVQGVGSEKGGGFVSVLEQKIGKKIINAGISGNTTEDGLARLDKDVLSKKPTLVFVLLGGNDFLRRLPKEKIFVNLKEIILRIQKEGSAVVLLGVQGGIFSDGYNANFETLARETGSIYVSNVLEGLIGNDVYMHDITHPNDVGYGVISGRIEKKIRSFLP
jgi:lysophospholipase L1-like esterase